LDLDSKFGEVIFIRIWQEHLQATGYMVPDCTYQQYYHYQAANFDYLDLDVLFTSLSAILFCTSALLL
jgi:hypothetical protein